MRHTRTINGKKYVTEQKAEQDFGLPRELLAMWSGREVPIPKNKSDRLLRIRVLFNHYLKVAGLKASSVVKEVGGHDFVAETFVKGHAKLTLNPPRRNLDKRTTHACQALACICFQLSPKGKGVSGKDFIDAIITAAKSKMPSEQEVSDEYGRYYAEMGK